MKKLHKSAQEAESSMRSLLQEILGSLLVVRAYIGGKAVAGLSAEETPHGGEVVFGNMLAVRESFSGCVGAPGILYLPEREVGKLEAVDCIFSQDMQFDARRRLSC